MIVIDCDLIRPCNLSDSHHHFGERLHHETLDIRFIVCNRLDELNIGCTGLPWLQADFPEMCSENTGCTMCHHHLV